jgi:hypothetical protein
MSEIVSIRSGEPIIQKGEPDPEVVERLEKLLEAAKSGQLSGIVTIALYSDDCTNYWVSGRRTRGLLGAVTMAAHGMMDEDLHNG